MRGEWRDSMDNRSSGNGASISFTSLLQIALIVLKLCHVLDWSWWLVLAPTWISVILVAAILGFIIWKESRRGRKR